MSAIIHLQTPLAEETVRGLRAGDEVLISGAVLTARDAAHVRLCSLIEAGERLPVDLAGQVIYFVGPTPGRGARPVGSAGPTTSSRMDRFSRPLYAAGLRGTIGKGYRGVEVIRSLQEFGAVHFSALGGAGALLSQCIQSAEVIAYEDLGTEAIRRLVVADFPATVAYDSRGGSVYESIGGGV